MKTYLLVYHSSEGAPPSEVVDKVTSVGFKIQKGYYDFVYEWDEQESLNEVLKIADVLHEVLRGTRTTFKLETSPD
jgi:hypothetical protein